MGFGGAALAWIAMVLDGFTDRVFLALALGTLTGCLALTVLVLGEVFEAEVRVLAFFFTGIEVLHV
jgi:hypothetical protein